MTVEVGFLNKTIASDEPRGASKFGTTAVKPLNDEKPKVITAR